MSLDSRCAIWGTPAREIRGDIAAGRITVYDSPRAGGSYSMELIIADREAPYLADDVKARMTTYLIRSREHGNVIPHIGKRELEEAQRAVSTSVHDRALSLLSYIAKETGRVGESVKLQSVTDSAMAWSESTHVSEVEYLANYLKSLGLVLSLSNVRPIKLCTVSVEGFSHLEKLRHAARSNQAFVAMWFDHSMDDLYDEGIKLGIEDAGYVACRIDQTPNINRIDDAIIREIRRSRFMVADFTQGDDGNRGSVYYEAGFARGLGLPVISTCQEYQFSTLAFDTRQFLHISWSEPADLRTPLANMIGAVIGDGTHA